MIAQASQDGRVLSPSGLRSGLSHLAYDGALAVWHNTPSNHEGVAFGYAPVVRYQNGWQYVGAGYRWIPASSVGQEVNGSGVTPGKEVTVKAAG